MNFKLIFYSLLWIAYIPYCYAAFPCLNDKVLFPIGIIIGVTAWLFNRTTALVFCFLGLVHQCIHFEFFADNYEVYQNRVSATAAVLFVIGTISSIRQHLEEVRKLNIHLDNLVTKRNLQLKALTQRLIQNSEQAKIDNSQRLHDGLGQQLAGIQLLCSSLADNLLKENNPLCAMTAQLGTHTKNAHNQIRRISRLLFPLKMGKTGLMSALQELAACMIELKSINFKVIEIESIPSLKKADALQIYRMCQDFSLYAIEELQAHEVRIEIGQTASTFQISIEHNGQSNQKNLSSDLFGLIKYRLQSVSGSITTKRIIKTRECHTISIPILIICND